MANEQADTNAESCFSTEKRNLWRSPVNLSSSECYSCWSIPRYCLRPLWCPCLLGGRPPRTPHKSTRSTELLELLLSFGVDANAQIQGINTALRAIPCADDYSSILNNRLLSANSADPNPEVKTCKSVLHVAIVQRCSNLVHVLLQATQTWTAASANTTTPIRSQGPRRTNNWRTMQLLANFGVDIDPWDFSSSGPYSDPWVAQANRNAPTHEELTQAIAAVGLPTITIVHRPDNPVPTQSVTALQRLRNIIAMWRKLCCSFVEGIRYWQVARDYISDFAMPLPFIRCEEESKETFFG